VSLSIGPETTVGALLAAYPDVEEVLVSMAPAFAKLRNPVVRRTVAKIATLEQVAKVGGVRLQTLITRLREATGQDAPGGVGSPSDQAVDQDAAWLNDSRVVLEIDADAMLERGSHPIGQIREGVATLRPGEVILLRSSFRPQSLIETMQHSGAAVHSSLEGATHLTWFAKG
jgi:hypothetical protein